MPQYNQSVGELFLKAFRLDGLPQLIGDIIIAIVDSQFNAIEIKETPTAKPCTGDGSKSIVRGGGSKGSKEGEEIEHPSSMVPVGGKMRPGCYHLNQPNVVGQGGIALAGTFNIAGAGEISIDGSIDYSAQGLPFYPEWNCPEFCESERGIFTLTATFRTRLRISLSLIPGAFSDITGGSQIDAGKFGIQTVFADPNAGGLLKIEFMGSRNGDASKDYQITKDEIISIPADSISSGVSTLSLSSPVTPAGGTAATPTGCHVKGVYTKIVDGPTDFHDDYWAINFAVNGVRAFITGTFDNAGNFVSNDPTTIFDRIFPKKCNNTIDFNISVAVVEIRKDKKKLFGAASTWFAVTCDKTRREILPTALQVTIGGKNITIQTSFDYWCE